jgi:predicted transcriptional regulator
MKSMPQEIEVWYLIPAIRRELTKYFIGNHNLNQKKISEILNITESAVSQYLKAKRGSEMKFDEGEIQLIEDAARRIVSQKLEANKEIYKLCVSFRGGESVCEVHRSHDSSIEKDCDLCC